MVKLTVFNSLFVEFARLFYFDERVLWRVSRPDALASFADVEVLAHQTDKPTANNRTNAADITDSALVDVEVGQVPH